MKRLLFSFAFLALSLIVSGQEPESFSYETIVHNVAGEVVLSQLIHAKISILIDSANGTSVYSERHKAMTNKQGLVDLPVGNGTDKSGNFTSINWLGEKYFLKVEIDPVGGNNYTDMSITQILDIPFPRSSESSKKASLAVTEDKLFISRRYVGIFVDYRQTGPDTFNGPNIIWIKTSMDDIFGKISAYGRKCDFSVGDKLYIKRSYYTPGGIFGFWIYRIENDSSVYYKITDFQHDRKVQIDTWFN
jgi:hypothetical protein